MLHTWNQKALLDNILTQHQFSKSRSLHMCNLSLYLQSQRGWKAFAPWPQQSFRGLPDNIVAMLCSLHYIIALRYQKAKQDPPQLLYTDRDCCSVTGPSKCAQLFAEWNHLQVSRHFDPSIMMMQLAGETGCMALHAKACTWLQHRVSPPLWSFYVSPLQSNF